MGEVRSQFVIFRLSPALLQPNDIDSGWEADDERGCESEVEVTIVKLMECSTITTESIILTSGLVLE